MLGYHCYSLTTTMTGNYITTAKNLTFTGEVFSLGMFWNWSSMAVATGN